MTIAIDALDNQLDNFSEQATHKLLGLRSHLNDWFDEFRRQGDKGFDSSELDHVRSHIAELVRLAQQIETAEEVVAKEVARMISVRGETPILRFYKDGRVRIRPEYLVRSPGKDRKARQDRILRRIGRDLGWHWEWIDRAVVKRKT